MKKYGWKAKYWWFLLAPVALLVLGAYVVNRYMVAWDHGRDLLVNYKLRDVTEDTTLFERPQPVGILDDRSLREVSGLAPSVRYPNCFWVIEDSGNPSQVQLIDRQGHVLARLTLPGVENRDWEDVAVGVQAGRSYVYVADIGDNRRRYDEKLIYRFAEPALNVAPGDASGTPERPGQHRSAISMNVAGLETLRLAIPDGAHDAESVMVDARTGDVYVLTKGGRSVLYRAAHPLSATRPNAMQPLLSIPFWRITSASISPDGGEILFRTYYGVYHYTRRPGESVADALRRKPRQLPAALEAQGEAIGWAADGQSFYTTSEQSGSGPQPLYVFKRRQ